MQRPLEPQRVDNPDVLQDPAALPKEPQRVRKRDVQEDPAARQNEPHLYHEPQVQQDERDVEHVAPWALTARLHSREGYPGRRSGRGHVPETLTASPNPSRSRGSPSASHPRSALPRDPYSLSQPQPFVGKSRVPATSAGAVKREPRGLPVPQPARTETALAIGAVDAWEGR